MTHFVVVKNALIVSEETIKESDLRIRGRYIDCINSGIKASQGDQIIEARGQYLLSGMIDDQVHFRELGLTHKGTIASESRAAVAGGITSFLQAFKAYG
jgi:dihydroorotase|tara:strand:- start:201 stop:497 length:297 start_codon:yes stop_codon:yes gene_type:complete